MWLVAIQQREDLVFESISKGSRKIIHLLPQCLLLPLPRVELLLQDGLTPPFGVGLFLQSLLMILLSVLFETLKFGIILRRNGRDLLFIHGL